MSPLFQEASFCHRETDQLWEELRTVVKSQEVVTRKEAYLAFSHAFKFSLQVRKENEKTQEIWRDFLETNALFIQESGRSYSFAPLRALLEAPPALSPLEAYQIEWHQADPQEEGSLQAIQSLFEESTGLPISLQALKPFVFHKSCFHLIGKVDRKVIAAAYGTFIPSLQVLHMNFLGRQPNYPGLALTQTLQEHIPFLKEHFFDFKGITCCALDSRPSIQKLYLSQNFEPLEYIENGFQKNPMTFYGKKLDENAELPDYSTFREEYGKVFRKADE